jgi:hypothetical protein
LCLCSILRQHPRQLEIPDEANPSWIIDISGEEGPSLLPTIVRGLERRAEWTTPTEWTACPYWADWRETLETAIMQVLRRIWARPGVRRIQREDFEDLRLTMQEALRALCSD